MLVCYAIVLIPVLVGAYLWLSTHRITGGEWFKGSVVGLADSWVGSGTSHTGNAGGISITADDTITISSHSHMPSLSKFRKALEHAPGIQYLGIAQE